MPQNHCIGIKITHVQRCQNSGYKEFNKIQENTEMIKYSSRFDKDGSN